MEWISLSLRFTSLMVALFAPKSKVAPLLFAAQYIQGCYFSVTSGQEIFPSSLFWLAILPFNMVFLSNSLISMATEVVILAVILNLRLDFLVTLSASLMSLWLCGISLIVESFRKEYVSIYRSMAEDRRVLVAYLAHELRNPLHTLLSSLDLMDEKDEVNLPMAKESAQQLKRVAANLSLFSDIIRSPYHRTEDQKETIEILPMVKELEKRLNNLANLSKVKLTYDMSNDVPNTFKGIRSKVEHVLEILLSNPMRYANFDAGKEKLLYLHVYLEDSMLVFSIQDNAHLLVDSEVKKLFTPFFSRAQDVIDNYGDIGLGLWISYELANGMGGSLTCEPTRNGNGFKLMLPLDPISDSKSQVDPLSKMFKNYTEKKSERRESEEKKKEKKEERTRRKSSTEEKRESKGKETETEEEKETKTETDKQELGEILRKHKKERRDESKTKKQDLSSQEKQEEKQENQKVKKILIVDDNSLNRDILSMMVRKIDKQAIIDTAFNGLVAVEMAQKETYKIILMDLSMPVMDGHEASRRIRQFDKNVIIAAVSGHAVASHIEEAMKNMNFFLPKPVSITQLRNILLV